MAGRAIFHRVGVLVGLIRDEQGDLIMAGNASAFREFERNGYWYGRVFDKLVHALCRNKNGRSRRRERANGCRVAGGNRYLTLNGRRDIGGIDLPSHGNYLGSLTIARDYEIRALYAYHGRPGLYPEKRPLAAEKTPDYYARVSAYDPEYGAPQVVFYLIRVTFNLRA